MAYPARVSQLSTNQPVGGGSPPAFNVDGAVGPGLRAFAQALTDGDLASGDEVIAISEQVDGNGNPSGAWEMFRGVFTDATPDTLSRVTLLRSSAGAAWIDWSATGVNAVPRLSVVAEPEVIPPRAFTAKGDLLVGTGASTYQAKPASTDGAALGYDSGAGGGSTGMRGFMPGDGLVSDLAAGAWKIDYSSLLTTAPADGGAALMTYADSADGIPRARPLATPYAGSYAATFGFAMTWVGEVDGQIFTKNQRYDTSPGAQAFQLAGAGGSRMQFEDTGAGLNLKLSSWRNVNGHTYLEIANDDVSNRTFLIDIDHATGNVDVLSPLLKGGEIVVAEGSQISADKGFSGQSVARSSGPGLPADPAGGQFIALTGSADTEIPLISTNSGVMLYEVPSAIANVTLASGYVEVGTRPAQTCLLQCVRVNGTATATWSPSG